MKNYALALLAIVLLTAAGIFLVARPRATKMPPPTIISTAPAEIKRPSQRSTPPDESSEEGSPQNPPPSPAPRIETRPPLAEHGAENVPQAEDLRISTTGAQNGNQTPYATERAEIHLLAASNNPGNVVPLARYLDHADAGVREEARNGLLLLGAKSGAPFLAAAAAKTTDPVESDLLKEAASFLTNPPPQPIAPQPSADDMPAPAPGE